MMDISAWWLKACLWNWGGVSLSTRSCLDPLACRDDVREAVALMALTGLATLRYKKLKSKLKKNWDFQNTKKMKGEIKGSIKPHTHSPSVSKMCQQDPFLISLICTHWKIITDMLLSLTWACFSTSAFKNMHFLVHLCAAAAKNNALLFFPPANLESFPLR